MGIDDIRQEIARLSVSCHALIATGIALRARAAGTPLDPALQGRLDDVLKALGVCEAVRGLSAAEIAPALAGIRADLLFGARMIAGPLSPPGWTYGESELLQSAGDVSAGFPPLLKTRIAPQLDGLSERLAAPGAAFLDVGVGVAALSIAMVRQWPSLRVVGIDPWAASLAIARRNVQGAGLTPQIELRERALRTWPTPLPMTSPGYPASSSRKARSPGSSIASAEPCVPEAGCFFPCSIQAMTRWWRRPRGSARPCGAAAS